MQNKKILITGACGYVGTALIQKLLEYDNEIICLDLMIYGDKSIQSFLNNKNINFFKSDIRNKNEIEKYFFGIDYVVHLAAIVGDKPCEAASEIAYQINFKATTQILDICKKYKIQKLIFASTCSNYGVSDPSVFATEKSDLNPVSLYAETKIDCEKFLKENSDDNLKIICLRFGTAFGASHRTRFDLTVNSFAYEAILGKKIYIYAPDSWRPYIHVADMAKIIIKFMLVDNKNLKSFDIYNAGYTKNNYQKKEIFSMILEYFSNLDFEVVQNIKDPRNYRVSFDKLEKFINLDQPLSINDGLKELEHAYKNKLISDKDFQNFNLASITKFFSIKGEQLKN